MIRYFIAALALVFMTPPFAWCQYKAVLPKNEPEKAAKPSNLEDLIAQALRNNPDIRVADSKVREAEAELNRTRMKVVSDVTFLHAEIQAAQAMVDYAAKNYERISHLRKSGTISEEVHREAALSFEKAKADLATKQAKLPYLLGNHGKSLTSAAPSTDPEYFRRTMLDVAGRVPTADEIQQFMKFPEKERRQKWMDHLLSSHWRSSPTDTTEGIRDIWIDHWSAIISKAESPMTEKLRKALDTPVKAVFKNSPPNKVMDFVREKTPGVNLLVRFKTDRRLPESEAKPITADFADPIPLGAFLQYVEDELGCTFVLRDYGVVVVNAEEKLPPGAVRVIDFWKRGKTPAKEKTDVEKAPTTSGKN